MHVGLGEVSFALAEKRGVDHQTMERIVSHAIELGIGLVEVDRDADVERRVGAVVKQLRARDRVVVATRLAAAEHVAADAELSRRLPFRAFRLQVDEMLRASQLEVLALVFVPLRAGWDQVSAWHELVGTCAQLVAAGKVLAWGARVDEPDLAAAGLLGTTFATLSVPYALCAREAEPLIAAAAAKHVAVHARRPLAGGALGGELAPGVALARLDDRRLLEDDELERIAVGVAKLAALVSHEPPAVKSCDAAGAARAAQPRPDNVACKTVAELALRWALGAPGITAVMPRVHRREYLAELVACGQADPLPERMRAWLDRLYPPT